MSVSNLALFDYFSIPNALFTHTTPPADATVSFDLQWTGPVTERRSIKDAANGFAGEFFGTSARMSWSAMSGDFHFVSDPASTSHSVAALLGNERNGRFV